MHSVDPLRVSSAGHVARIEIDRPETRNALSPELTEELAGALEQLDGDDGIRAIVIAGTDDVFASGADIRALADPSNQRRLQEGAASFWRRLGAIRKPTVAAVSGWALGSGLELALACDMCVAARDTQFAQADVTLGIIPGGGATQQLARVLGKQLAMEYILTGRRFDADQAARWGLVNLVTRKDGWLDGASELAAEVAARAPVATRLAKQAILSAEREHLDQALETERRLLEETMATADRIEGMNALIEGRRPEFEGR